MAPIEALDTAVKMARYKEARWDWSKMPPSFQADAVKWVYEQSLPYFRKHEIRQRINAKAARTFYEFYKAIGAV